MPDKPALEGLEAKWGDRWQADGTFLFDREAALAAGRDGDLLDRHSAAHRLAARCTSGTSSATRTPTSIARFQRMRGKHVFYPMGWDDNGLPTERRVQNYYGVRCDPSLPYDAGFVAAVRGRRQQEHQGRRPEADLAPQLHRAVRAADRRGREAVRGALALARPVRRLVARPTAPSATRRCAPRSSRSSATSSAARPTRRMAPTLWDVTFRTAVAQAELEDRDQPGAYHRVSFHGADGPVVHRDDPAGTAARLRRAGGASGRRALPAAVRHDRDARPLFGVEVPVLAHHLAQPDKGIRHRHDLHVRRHHRRHLVARARPARTARSSASTAASSPRRPTAITHRGGQGRLRRARRQDGLLGEAGGRRAAARRPATSIGEPKPIQHPVKFFEKGDKPARDRLDPPVVREERRARRGAARSGSSSSAASSTGTPTSCACATRTGWAASPATG